MNENNVFVDASNYSGVDDMLSHRGSVVFDFDHDGDLDIASSVVKMPWGAFANVDQKIKLYRNESNAGNYIGIQLIGSDGINIDCFGCRVLFEQDDKQMMREVDGGSGQASQSSRILYFGLGTGTELSKATIFWADNTTTILTKLKNGSIYSVNKNGKVKRMK